jgi:DNA polymerase-3 subunit delta
VKFQQLSAFGKHLEKACPDHLSRAYLVAIPCAYERKKVCEQICSYIEKKEGKVSVLSFDGTEQWPSISEELHMLRSLGPTRVVIVQEADKLKKNALDVLSALLSKSSFSAYLILSAPKPLAAFYESGKKELVLCDLSAEKPWERKERLKAHLLKMAASEKKSIAPEAVDGLLERVGAEYAQLEQEMKKLLCYCADKPRISSADVALLCPTEKASSVWQLAEAIVWQENAPVVDPGLDTSSFLFLITQVRAHLQQGKILALGGASSFFKPQLLEKVAPVARKRQEGFFTRGLQLAFEMEMLAKQGSFPPVVLVDMLIAKMRNR